jgi:FkbM family methyltransferase
MSKTVQLLRDRIRESVRHLLPLQMRWVHGQKFALSEPEWEAVHLSFSQYGEDLLVWELLRREGRTSGGFYVDVGAFDPVLYSNTKLLYHKGWHGLNLDLNDEAIARFNQLRPRDRNVHCAVSETEREMVFCKYPVAATNRLFPADETNRRSLLQEEPIETKVVTALPLSSLLDKYLPPDARFDFLDIDCEGHDLAVLKSNDWSRHRPFVLAVEDTTNEPDSETVRYCVDQGYDLAATLFISRIFLDQNASAEAKAAWRVHGNNSR